MRICRQFGFLAVTAIPVWAHSGTAGARDVHWSWDIGTTVPLALVLVLYIAGIARMRRRSVPIQWRTYAYFAAGWASLLIALNSPVHSIGEQLFWVHMTQHEILVLVSAPLLVLARPLVPFLWTLPRSWRDCVGKVSKWTPLSATWVFVSAPLAAWVLHAAALWLWHAPSLFDATLHSDFIHALQHLSFFGTALLFWWALVHRHGGRLGLGPAIAYVFTTVVHTSILGALLTFAPTVWYRSYIGTAPLWNLTALQDQQLGGLIMWVPSGTLLTAVGLATLASWLRESDRRWQYTRTATLLRISAGGARED